MQYVLRSLARFGLSTLLVLAAADVFTGPAAAQTLSFNDGFRSPSDNIHCMYFGHDAVLRCDLRQIVNAPSPKPTDCDLEWGQAFEVFAKKNQAGPICHGDTVADSRLPILGYGESWTRGDFVCQSERSGVACRNSAGAGFDLSRAAQRVIGSRPR
jgi:hypothetical protein